jgi:hypothetical protein
MAAIQTAPYPSGAFKKPNRRSAEFSMFVSETDHTEYLRNSSNR